MSAMKHMPKYRCRKEVWALKIGALMEKSGKVWMQPEEEGYAAIPLDSDYVAKHNPQVGGYYVVYSDGYKSWSPAEAFEEGYHLIPMQ